MKSFSPEEHRPLYRYRIFARLIDLIFVAWVLESFQKIYPGVNVLVLPGFFVYNVIVILLNGKTIGRYALSLDIRPRQMGLRGRLVLLARELFFILAFPIIILNLLLLSSLPVHDRLCQTHVQRDTSSPLAKNGI